MKGNLYVRRGEKGENLNHEGTKGLQGGEDMTPTRMGGSGGGVCYNG